MSKIFCQFSWYEKNSICLESHNEGRGDSCYCSLEIPTLDISLMDEITHAGPHVCKCGEIYVGGETVENRSNVPPSDRLSIIKRLLHMDPTRHGAIPSFQSEQFQKVMQSALLLDIAESLREIKGLLENVDD